MDADSMHNKNNQAPLEDRPKAPEAPKEATSSAEGAPAPAAVNTTDAPLETVAAMPQNTNHPQNSAGIVVLQWLTYAFWGWLIIALIWLMAVVLVNALIGDGANGSVPYAIAATVVLLPIAFLCDLFYRKHEPVKKAGAAMVIMVIHAVIFALCGIGALVTSVFLGLDLAINGSSSADSQTVGLLTTLFASVLYVAAFLRTLNPFKNFKLSRAYGIGMLALAALLLTLTAVGPLLKSVSARGDQVIERGLPSVQSSISDYVTENRKLPATLNDLEILDEDAQTLVSDNKVEYKAVGEVTNTDILQPSTKQTFRYTLCVEYAAKKNTSNSRSTTTDTNYRTYISTYSHDSGRVCYKLQESVYKDAAY